MTAWLENGTRTLGQARLVMDERVESAEQLKHETAQVVVVISAKSLSICRGLVLSRAGILRV